MRSRTTERRLGIGLAVLLLHGLLGWWLSPGLQSTPPARTRMSVYWVAEKRPAPTRIMAPATPQPAPKRSLISRAAVPPLAAPAEPPAKVTAPEAPPTSSAAPASEPAVVQAPAPASAPRPLLLDTESTRQAVRNAARQAPLGVGLPQESAEQRLSRQMQEGARGDCLKGDFAGGGAGLLSLPFLAWAKASGKCAK